MSRERVKKKKKSVRKQKQRFSEKRARDGRTHRARAGGLFPPRRRCTTGCLRAMRGKGEPRVSREAHPKSASHDERTFYCAITPPLAPSNAPGARRRRCGERGVIAVRRATHTRNRPMHSRLATTIRLWSLQHLASLTYISTVFFLRLFFLDSQQNPPHTPRPFLRHEQCAPKC